MMVDHELAVRLAQRLHEKGHISREKLEAFKANHRVEEEKKR